MSLIEFYEKYGNESSFNNFLDDFLKEIFPKNIDISEYKQLALEYLIYDKDDFLHILKYYVFGMVDSEYIKKIFDSFQKNNQKWVDFIWNSSEDRNKVKDILAHLGNKKVEVLKTIVNSSFKSLENDVKNGEIVTNMLNSIVEHLQEMQKNQNMMLANISHEMRTPLNSVIGYLDILEANNTLSIEDKKNVSYAKNSSKLLLTLINDLLDTQKLSSAKLDLGSNPFWINKIIKNALSISSVNAKQKNIDFIYIDEMSVFDEVIGDKNRFLQILNNLFNNAVKFTPENGRIIITSKSQNLGDKIQICISVKDTGIGIPKDKQKDLFKPFSRATNKEKGTGLGLYISKQLANKMDGDIWFESEENKGSTFFVRLVFKKSKNFYDKNLLKQRKIVILKDKKLTNYCKNLCNQLTEVGSKVKIFTDENKFMQFLMFNSNIDIAIIVYPNEIEKNELDISFIKTFKKINENANFQTSFIAGVGDNYYPRNSEVFDKLINVPITILDIFETFSAPKVIKSNYKYLIIDDEPMNRMVLSTMIKSFDKKGVIETANDGIDGLEKLKQNSYDVVFLDKRMPKLDGYGVLEELKKLNIQTNVYLLTADGDNETINKAKEYNVGYIAKPVTLSTLKSVVEHLSGGG